MLTVFRIGLNKKSRKAGQQDRVVRVNAKSCLELLLSFCDEPRALQHETIPDPCGNIIGGHTNHVRKESKVILPNPIVTDAQQRAGSQDSCCKQVLQAFGWKGHPGNTCQKR